MTRRCPLQHDIGDLEVISGLHQHVRAAVEALARQHDHRGVAASRIRLLDEHPAAFQPKRPARKWEVAHIVQQVRSWLLAPGLQGSNLDRPV